MIIYAISTQLQCFVYTMSKTKVLNLRIDPDLKKQAKKLAEKDERTLSNWVTHLIRREVERLEKKD